MRVRSESSFAGGGDLLITISEHRSMGRSRSGRFQSNDKGLFNFKRPRWSPAARLLASIVLIGLAFAACRRPSDTSPSITIRHEVSPAPPRVGPAKVSVKMADESGKVVTGAHVSLECDMSHPGMGPIMAEAKEEAPGEYQANVTFSMAGDWVVLVHSTLPNGRKVEKQFKIDGVQSD